MANGLSWFIVIPVFNPPESFLGNLRKLEEASPGAPARVLLVDDGSSNGVPREAELQFPGLTRIQGDGDLWWCGGMKLGMAHALEKGASVIVWLNHDCVPDSKTLERLVEIAQQEGNGAVSAWCRSADSSEFSVNPGFRNLREIPVKELRDSELVAVDGVNGNCVAINVAAIRAVGLPDAKKHPHYGDGPYTYLLHRSGFRNWILTTARASLEREYDRCVSVRWRCAFWRRPLWVKLGYYFLSKRSKYHFAVKYYDVVAFRGCVLAPFVYVASLVKVLSQIVTGHLLGILMNRGSRIDLICREYDGVLPKRGMLESITRLENESN